ncbi:hypothetical protein RSOLAG22IIIB_11850 [Rhizoctonia solani]|uniref:Uncharacterized protein n=1 Tax=Rhizoctonia solani TaxID=456999 RepID=A0A0K6GAU0_9AGAM|nr:hypothetical protein RSOLAG22IIIB_11850 [Rhizoctonia solani]
MIESGTLKRKRQNEEEEAEYAPTATVLLAIPMLVSHPPDHPLHIPGLRVSLKALRRCTGLTSHNDNAKRTKGDGWIGYGEAMTPEVEIRAWIALAEVGMMVIRTRCSRWGEDDQTVWEWTLGVEQDIDTALRKGLALATSLPSLRAFKEPLTLLSARAATPKRALKILSTMLSSVSSVPTKYTYEAYLALADLHLRPSGKSTPGQGKWNPNLGAGLHVLEQMRTRAQQTGDVAVAQLAMIAILRAKIVHSTDSGVSEIVQELEVALHEAEETLCITYPIQTETNTTDRYSVQPPSSPTRSVAETTPQTPKSASIRQEDPISDESLPTHVHHLRVHVLFLGVALYTHLGDAQNAAQRLGKLHSILDTGLLEFPDEACFCGRGSMLGSNQSNDMPTVDVLGLSPVDHPHLDCPCASSFLLPIPLASNDSLLIKSTHPRTIFELAFLVSSIARRDVVGRKPRRFIFAIEGLRAGTEMGVEVAFPVWATLEDVKETELRLAEIRADLMCELVAIATMRSEFEVAEQRLSELVAHTRNFDLFDSFVARISLHYAHLAHARGQTDRARTCYEAAIRTSATGSFIHTSSSAGLIGLQMGIAARDKYITSGSKTPSTPPPESPAPKPDQKLLAACTYALAPLAHILVSSTLPIVRAKQELKTALDLSSKAQDNYLRALSVAMSAAKYMHTAESHAGVMLSTVKGLAAGMGAVENKKSVTESPSKDAPDGNKLKDKKSSPGNAVLGLWVGLRLYELHKRAGDNEHAKKQDLKNRRLIKAVDEIEADVKGKMSAQLG